MKRQNVTMFLYTEPQQTIQVLKELVCKLEQSDPANTQLRFGETVLEESKTIQDYKLDEGVGPIVFLLHKTSSGEWETPDIHDPEPKGVPREAIEVIKAQAAAQSK